MTLVGKNSTKQIKNLKFENTGVQKNKWFDWMNMAYKSNYIVEYLPLNDKMVGIFDNNLAVKWFKKVEGMPYGYNNYLFCWIDTLENNYPFPLSSQFMEIGLSHVGLLFPEISNKMWNKAQCFKRKTA